MIADSYSLVAQQGWFRTFCRPSRTTCLSQPYFWTACPSFFLRIWQQPLKTSRLSPVTRAVRFLLMDGSAPVHRCIAS